MDNREKVNSILGKDIAESNLTRAIEIDEITPFTKAGMTPDWKAMEKSATSKYGDLGEEIVWQTRVFYSINHQDWKGFGESLKPWFDKYGYKRFWINAGLINNVAWAAFEHTDNKDALEAAAKMASHGLKENEMSALIDTYANLLYKLGKKKKHYIGRRKHLRRIRVIMI
ncbi:hypothetical protein [Chitinophaga pinensis]|uniref:Uncharacterized protein n=1 Tax=Chitinophaga pinensis TaxID=79329 RepID=A0A5C6LKE6_9BACT|nr:hypothetical protein [Chitinophaga pinensis]TWV89887.1 hypothetical protein FEF09_29710 [Chitinophaga pinensis]